MIGPSIPEIKSYEDHSATMDQAVALLATINDSVANANQKPDALHNAAEASAIEAVSPNITPEVKEEPPLSGEGITHNPDTSETGVDGNTTTAILNSPKSPLHVVFVDFFGTRWILPYEDSKTWNGVKKLVKNIFVDVYVAEWLTEYLDDEEEGPGQSFSIVKIKPERSNVLSTHWERLVSPGWEFKIEFTLDVIYELRKEKRLAKQESQSEEEEETDKEIEAEAKAKELSKIVYVAKYLAPDRDGDYIRRETKAHSEKTSLLKDFTETPKSILEEHREVYFSNRTVTNVEETMYDTIGSPVLFVHSPILLNALKAIIGCQALPDMIEPVEYRAKLVESDLGRGQFVYPFTDLHHYRERLLQYKEEVSEIHDNEYSATCREHIDILFEYLDNLPETGLKSAELLWKDETPRVTFSSLWLLLKSGADVFVQEEGKLNAYVIESFEGGVQWHSPFARSLPYTVNVWNLNFNGQYLGRSVRQVKIPVFDGPREINSLPLFPVQFHVEEDPQNPLREQLIDRGKKFVNMVKTPTFQEYNGPSRLQGNRQFKQARVIIDHTSQPWKLKELEEEKYAHRPIEEVYGVDLGKRTREPKCLCKTCETNNLHRVVQRRTFDDYDIIDLTSKPTLSDHQYLLCWSHVYGYVLKDRAWDVLEVSGLRDPKIHKGIIDTLVMKPESNKQLIKAVCETFGGTYTQAFSSDFIQGKGEGQILLLHGPPGTGKTLTAESVAEYTGRPLLSITAADLGHEPEPLEYNLLSFFRNARKWNAIVLLDEADVYLETRSPQDLRRNSIVSIFLRALDYFQGILFLTTNRVGSFDEAFMSRIHVQIGYDPLDEDSRKQIWDGYFKKLSKNHEDEGQEIRCSYDAKEFVRRSDDLRALNWNGREIRNAFQTAVALACFQAKQEGKDIPELTDDHLRQVVTMSHNFKSYLKAVRGKEESLAFAAGIRNDATGASGGGLRTVETRNARMI
ncbi:ATPase AAA-type core [Penicillium longicatenatum]|uniref:ATPase AAA-type core n=1 Tax=Penicillium longicatenatum TaxID=1561947 RepID=UPI002547854C|nr:ATPase AAA-type core [Penicillium longicatenatum]KAJ5650644.1 ATPase AAA-type core [Penicillium longicatenatum]